MCYIVIHTSHPNISGLWLWHRDGPLVVTESVLSVAGLPYATSQAHLRALVFPIKVKIVIPTSFPGYCIHRLSSPSPVPHPPVWWHHCHPQTFTVWQMIPSPSPMGYCSVVSIGCFWRIQRPSWSIKNHLKAISLALYPPLQVYTTLDMWCELARVIRMTASPQACVVTSVWRTLFFYVYQCTLLKLCGEHWHGTHCLEQSLGVYVGWVRSCGSVISSGWQYRGHVDVEAERWWLLPYLLL